MTSTNFNSLNLTFKESILDGILLKEKIDIDLLDTEMIIKLKYTEDEYNLVKEQLNKIAQTPEQAVWKLLGNE